MSDFKESLKAPITEVLAPFADMTLRSAPDSLFFGSAVLALVTQSYALSVFAFAMLQIAGVGFLTGKFSAWTSPVTGGPAVDNCGYQIPSWSKFSFLEWANVKAPFPSSPVYFVSAVIAYVLGSTIDQRREITHLARQFPEMKVRFPISPVLSILFLTSFILWRIVRQCDGVLVAFGSLLFGFVIGSLLLLLNIQLFGREAVNFAGLPLLVNRLGTNQPLYVCSAE